MTSRALFIAVGLLSLLFTACSQIPTRPAADWAPPAWNAWELQGRIAVRAGEEGWHASLKWQQNGAGYQADLSGPLGQGALRLRGDDAGVTLERANGERDQSTDADALLARHTGWSLPVKGLRYWVLGLEAPGSAADWERDISGRPQILRQDGWVIRYTDFLEQPGLGQLPRRIDMERAGLNARLLIDSWTVQQPD